MKKSLIIYAALAAILLILAVIYGPKSCNGGLTIYFNSGLLLLIVSLILPIFMDNEIPRPRKTLVAAGLAGLSVLLWLLGFVLGNFRLICKLF